MISGTKRPRAIIRAGRLVVALAAVGLISQLGGSVAAANAENGASQGPTAESGRTLDRSILDGYRRYNASCNHCHGPDGTGSSLGPGLIEAPMAAEALRDAVLNGRSSGLNVMKGFVNDPNVVPYVDDIYAYLRARADGLVGRGRPRVDPWGIIEAFTGPI